MSMREFLDRVAGVLAASDARNELEALGLIMIAGPTREVDKRYRYRGRARRSPVPLLEAA